MYEALVARVRYHIQKANFMGLKEAESTLLLGEAADAIEELQTDMRPVMRGKWINQRADSEMCSACGVRFYISALFAVGGNDEPNYCPNCGARMDGEA